MICRLQTIGSGGIAHISVDTAGPQIRSGTEHGSLYMVHCSGKGLYSAKDAILHNDLRNFRLTDSQMIRIFQCHPHLSGIFLLIRLCPKGMHRRPFGFIQHLGLNKSFVNIFSHFSPKGIQLSHQVPLGASSDIGVAGHQGNAVYTDGKKNRLQSQPCTCQSRFTARMACAHHCHIISFL